LADDLAAWDELGSDVLVRALPAAAGASSAEFAGELRRGRRKLAVRLGSGAGKGSPVGTATLARAASGVPGGAP